MVIACNKQKVKEIVHVSALGVSESAPSEYLRSKYAGEKILEEFEGNSVILRPSVVFGPGDSFMNFFAKLQKYSPIMPMALTKTQFQPIYLNDLVEIILRSINMLKNKKIYTYECVGPEIFTLYEIIKFSGIYSGRKAMVIPLPKFIGLNSSVYFGKNAWSNVDVKRQYSFHECSFDSIEKQGIGFQTRTTHEYTQSCP